MLASPCAAANCADPIDLLAAEHAMLRAACVSLERLAAAERPDRDAARFIAAQLRAILPHHAADEEQRLFPLLRDRAEPEDEIDLVLGRLAAEHAEGGARVPEILALLDRLAGGSAPATPAEREAIDAYATAKLRHLSLEAAIVLPLARERLSAADRADLGDAMMRRRASQAAPGAA